VGCSGDDDSEPRGVRERERERERVRVCTCACKQRRAVDVRRANRWAEGGGPRRTSESCLMAVSLAGRWRRSVVDGIAITRSERRAGGRDVSRRGAFNLLNMYCTGGLTQRSKALLGLQAEASSEL
jgi:hypothetical protein